MVKIISFSDKAYADIDRIVEFNNLRNRSDTYSNKFLKRLEKRLLLLEKQPLVGINTDEADVLLLIWDSYYIFYIIYDTTIEIASIYHQKENVNF